MDNASICTTAQHNIIRTENHRQMYSTPNHENSEISLHKGLRKRAYKSLIRKQINQPEEQITNFENVAKRSSMLFLKTSPESKDCEIVESDSSFTKPNDTGMVVTGQGYIEPETRVGITRTPRTPKVQTAQYIPKQVSVPQMPEMFPVELPIKKTEPTAQKSKHTENDGSVTMV